MSGDLLGIGKLVEALEKGTREVRELAKTYYAPIAKEKGELRADRIRVERKLQAIKMMLEADRLLQEAGVKSRKLIRKIALPVLEFASLESDDQLTMKWAGLLASSVAGDSVHVSFPQILNELTPGEARILDLLYAWQEEAVSVTNWSPMDYTMQRLRMEIGLSKEEFQLSAENILRLRLCRADVFWSFEAAVEREDEVRLIITPLGISFVKTCRGPSFRQNAATQPE